MTMAACRTSAGLIEVCAVSKGDGAAAFLTSRHSHYTSVLKKKKKKKFDWIF